MPTDRTLADFAGHWDIARWITPDAGPTARFAGQAEWRPTGDGLAYAETGMLYLDGATSMRAERRYRWNADLRVYFDDGRFFHQVPAAGGQTEHWCDPDTYVVTYDFSAWPRFDTVWHVTGPRKSYRMASTFTRRAGP